MRLLKFMLLLVFGALLLFSAVGQVLNIAQLFSINLSTSALLNVSLTALTVYLLLVNFELKWQLSRKRAMQERIDRLARFRQRAITELYAQTPTVDEFPGWLARFTAWEESLVQYLMNNFPFAVFEMFQDLGIILQTQFIQASRDPAISAQHVHHLRILAKHISILERLIQENTGLLREEKPGLGELLKWLPGD